MSYMIYQPRKLKLGVPHPDPVVENASMAAVDPPELWYRLKLQVYDLPSLFLPLFGTILKFAQNGFSPPFCKKKRRKRRPHWWIVPKIEQYLKFGHWFYDKKLIFLM